MKSKPTVSPSQYGTERHVPGDPHDDHGQQHCARHAKVMHDVVGCEVLDKRTDLQADEDEREDVESEDDRIPDCIARDAVARRNAGASEYS
jgi:hypothetical protein